MQCEAQTRKSVESVCRRGSSTYKLTILGMSAFLALAIVAFSLPVVAGSIADAVTEATLDNGLKVIVQEDHSTDLVAIDISIRAGSAYETAESNGVAHFIEHLLFRGTTKRGPGQVDMEIESLGATLEARTGRDWAHFYTVVASKYVNQTLEILSDVINNPTFRAEDIEHERKVILDEIARRMSNPTLVVTDLAFDAAYSGHPYGLPIEGTRDRIASITREQIVSHYKKLYVPSNMAVTLVGDVATPEAIAAVKGTFGSIEKKPPTSEPIRSEPLRNKQTRKVVKRNTRLTYITIAFPGPSVNDRPAVFAADVLASYLGVGYQSWLTGELRDNQKLAVNASCDFLTQRYPGLILINISAEPSKAEQAEAAVFSKIERLRSSPISSYELSRAVRSLIGNYAFDVETFSGRATNLGYYESIGRFDLARTYMNSIRSVTTDDVLATAKAFLDPSQAVVVVLGP